MNFVLNLKLLHHLFFFIYEASAFAMILFPFHDVPWFKDSYKFRRNMVPRGEFYIFYMSNYSKVI